VRALAAFASSDAGRAFARVEDRFGRDPAAALEPIDDVLAHNLRVAFCVVEDQETEEPDPHREAIERTRKAGEVLRG
jgi:hypothetical protein